MISAKLLVHTSLCVSLAMILVLHIKAGRRRVVLSTMLVAVLLLAFAPFAYRLWPGGIWPRMTIHWAQILFVGSAVFAFSPGLGKSLAVMDDDFDMPGTLPAPLESPLEKAGRTLH